MAEAPLLLIAEDNERLRDRLDEAFRVAGFRTIAAEHGGEALEAMLCDDYRGRISAIVTDFSMRGDVTDGSRLNGDEFLRALLPALKEKNIPLPPVVVYTAEPQNALPAMQDMLDIKDINACFDGSLQLAGDDMAGNAPAALVCHRFFTKDDSRRPVRVVAKKGYFRGELADILKHLVSMGVALPETPERPPRGTPGLP